MNEENSFADDVDADTGEILEGEISHSQRAPSTAKDLTGEATLRAGQVTQSKNPDPGVAADGAVGAMSSAALRQRMDGSVL
jgi:hypothetical protein